jgi:hypothetical protein
MGFSKNTIISILVYILATNFVSNTRCQEQEDLASISPLHAVALDLAAACRYTEYTKVSLPFDAKEFELSGVGRNQAVFSYIPSNPEDPTLLIHALITENLDSAQFCDATFLCTGETAEEFYNGNYEYVSALEGIDYIRSFPPHMTVNFVPAKFVSPSGEESNITIYQSHDRVLIHVCGWIEYLAIYDKDLHRALEFLTFILQKQNEVLQELLSEKDYERLKSRLGHFDQFFPYLIFEEPLYLGSAQKDTLISFFETTLDIRNRLEALKPTDSPYIKQDSVILKILGVE